MPGISGDWAAQSWQAQNWMALSSEHERLVQAAGDSTGAASLAETVPAPWAELASQRERLVAAAPPLSGLASSSYTESGMRLVIRAA
jgi:hypothetical protein